MGTFATLKLGRGENFEALDFLSFMRTTVTAPLFQIKNEKLPRGLRKVEMNYPKADLEKLVSTVPSYNTDSLFTSLDNTVNLYLELRQQIFPTTINLRTAAQEKILQYLQEIKSLKQG